MSNAVSKKSDPTRYAQVLQGKANVEKYGLACTEAEQQILAAVKKANKFVSVMDLSKEMGRKPGGIGSSLKIMYQAGIVDRRTERVVRPKTVFIPATGRRTVHNEKVIVHFYKLTPKGNKLKAGLDAGKIPPGASNWR